VSVREVSCGDVAARLSELVLVDVRTPGEHELVALPGSILLPLQELEDRVEELAPLRGKEVVVYCHHGVRSLHGAAFLNAHGVSAVSMEGGIDAWSREVDSSVPRY
jgi:rhodanese-related sulfurtransferase